MRSGGLRNQVSYFSFGPIQLLYSSFRTINRDLYLGALQATNWESRSQALLDCDLNSPREAPCTQGRISVYAVLAESAEEIQKAVRFARDQNLRVVIRNTGHNALGQSSSPGSLQINTSRLKRIEPVSDFIPQGTDASVGQAATLGAGVLALEVAQVGLDQGFTSIMGLCNTVGSVGGFIQGGGVGLLGPLYGMGSDNAVEFNVVTAEVGYSCLLPRRQSTVFCCRPELSKPTG